MKSMWLLGVVLLIAGASAVMARQGVVRTKDGRSFEGDVTDKGTEGAVIGTRFGSLSIGREDIASIDYTDNIPEQYKQKLAALPKTAGAPEHVALGEWLMENKAYDLAMIEADTALQLDPDNRNATLLKRVAERQLLWSRQPEKTATPAEAVPAAPVVPATPVKQAVPATPAPADRAARTGRTNSPAAAIPADALNKEQRRVLTSDEIASIRRTELRSTDRLSVKLEKNVKKRYTQANPDSAKQFNAMSDAAKAAEILRSGTSDMIADVKIQGDPAPIAEFRRSVQPLLVAGCASASCHGGNNSGSFLLHRSGKSDEMTYTNYYILSQYSTNVNGVTRKAIDRANPAESLVLQYALPPEKAQAAHPNVPGYSPLFRVEGDVRQQQLVKWLSSLGAVEPKYAVQLQVHQGTGASPALPTGAAEVPTTQPAAEIAQPTPPVETNPVPPADANPAPPAGANPAPPAGTNPAPLPPPPPPSSPRNRGTDANDALKQARERMRSYGL